jgi:hypothetical protein
MWNPCLLSFLAAARASRERSLPSSLAIQPLLSLPDFLVARKLVRQMDSTSAIFTSSDFCAMLAFPHLCRQFSPLVISHRLSPLPFFSTAATISSNGM